MPITLEQIKVLTQTFGVEIAEEMMVAFAKAEEFQDRCAEILEQLSHKPQEWPYAENVRGLVGQAKKVAEGKKFELAHAVLAEAREILEGSEERHLQARKEELGKKLDGLPKEPPDANPSQLERLNLARQELQEKLAAAKVASDLDTVAKLIESFEGLDSTIRKEIVAEQKRFEEARAALRKDGEWLANNPPDATGAHLKLLASARQTLGERIEAAKKLEDLASARSALEELKTLLARITEEIEAEKKRLAELKSAIESDLLALGTDPKSAEEKQIKDLAVARQAVADALKPPVTADSLAAAREKLEKLRLIYKKVKEDPRRLKILRTAVNTELSNLGGNPKDCTQEQAGRLNAARKEVADTLKGQVGDDEIKLASEKVQEVRRLLETINREIEQEKLRLASEKKKIEEELAGLKDNPEGSTSAHIVDLTKARELVTKSLSAAKTTTNSVDDAGMKLLAFKEMLARVKLEIEAEKQRVEGIKEELNKEFTALKGGGEVLKGLLQKYTPEQLKTLSAKLKGTANVVALGEALGPDSLGSLCDEMPGGADGVAKLLQDGCDGDASKLKALCEGAGGPKALSELAKDGFGDTETLCTFFKTGCGGNPNKLKELNDAFKGKDLPNLKSLLKEGMGNPEALATLLNDGCGGDAKKLKELESQFPGKDGAKKLNNFMKEGLGGKPVVLAKLLKTGCSGKAADFKKLVDAFAGKGDLKALKGVIEKGGCGEKPEVLGELLKTGCDGNPAELKKVMLAFQSEPDLQNLKGMIEKGGCGEKPAVLAHLLKPGCAGKPEGFKQLVTQFKAEGDQKNFKQLIEEGGMGDKPQCLGQMLAIGFDGKSNALQGATKLKQMSKDLDTPERRANMKDLLEAKGGLGDNPEVFGHLVATGCDKNPASVKQLLDTLDKPGRDGLNKLVSDGGFAKNDAKGVKPECLGELLATGCEKDPAELQKLAKGLNDTDRTSLKGMLEEGKLGKEPKVLGHMYKTGCQKKPDDLHKFCDEFKTAEDHEKLKGLLESGGFNGRKGVDQRPETLGEVMKDAFTDRNKNPGDQLKKLHDAFKPNAGANELADLNRIVGAFNFAGQAQGLNGKPGKRFKTLMKHFNDDPSKVKTVFNQKMKDQSDPGTRIPLTYPSVAAYLPLDELMVNAATFEVDGLPALSNPTSPPRPPHVTVTAMAHFCKRHIRQYQPFVYPDLKDADTTFWEEGKTPDQVKALAEEAHTEFTNLNLPWKPGGDVLTRGHMSGLGNYWQAKSVNLPSGYPVKIGYEYKPNPGARIENTQFYPKSTPGLTTINSGDLRAIKAALGK